MSGRTGVGRRRPGGEGRTARGERGVGETDGVAAGRVIGSGSGSGSDTRSGSGSGSGLIYCGLCGALNPATSHFCAACGTTLVDAFHATEGTRVFDRPDPAARLVEIIAAGEELEVVAESDPTAPVDYVRVRIPSGKLGYVRLADVGQGGDGGGEAGAAARAPDINTNARGCVSSGAALAALGLLVIMALFGLVIILRARPTDAGILWLFYCSAVVPLLALTIGLYVAARSREERQTEDEAELTELSRGGGQPPA